MKKSKTVEKILYKTDKKASILLMNDAEDGIWEDAVAEDFVKGYSDKDADYDKLWFWLNGKIGG